MQIMNFNINAKIIKREKDYMLYLMMLYMSDTEKITLVKDNIFVNTS